MDARGWLEAELRRGGDEESLIRAIAARCRENVNHAWDILSQLDQFYRRGRIPEPIFQTVKRRTEQLAVGTQVAMQSGTHPATDRRRVLRSRYELTEQLGHGTVYQALDRLRSDLPVGEQYVSIKLLPDTGQAGAPQLAQLLRASHLAQSLSHPNIARVYDVDRDLDQVFVVMQLLHGMSLQQLLQEVPGHKIPLTQALAIVRDIGAALVYAHSRHVAHGDLRPQKVNIDFDRTLLVRDFGRTADPVDDLHALGCIAYELIAGEHPFGGQSVMEARQLGLHARRPTGLARQRWRALQGALSWERERCPASVAAWLSQMQLEDASERLAPLSVLLQAPAPRRGGAVVRWLLTGTAGLAALVATGVWGPRPASLRSELSRPQLRAQAQALKHAPAPSLAAPSSAATALAAAAPPRAIDTATVTIAASPAAAEPAPAIQLAAESTLVAEGEAAARITILRSGDLHGDIDFSWWTEPGTARPGTDYVADGPQQAQIADGQESVLLFVPLINDSTLQGDVEFIVRIGSPTGAALGDTTRGVVRIVRGR